MKIVAPLILLFYALPGMAQADKPPEGWSPALAGWSSYTIDPWRSENENLQFHWNVVKKCVAHGHVVDPELDNPYVETGHSGWITDDGEVVKEIHYGYYCIRCRHLIHAQVSPLRHIRRVEPISATLGPDDAPWRVTSIEQALNQ